ncbi:MAG: O-antigen ligase family protein [Prevotellaceae bacterium]|nr:O-antigen ligase family protein [Prevotellaceae bacterium]
MKNNIPPMRPNINHIKPNIAQASILLTSFFIPFSFANGLLYVWLALFVFTLKKEDFSSFKLFAKQSIPQISILLLYLLGVISLFYVENISAAIKQLTGQRLLMLLLPLAAIVGLRGYSFFDILKTYILGCFCFLLYGFLFLSWQFASGIPVDFLTFPHYISEVINKSIMHRSYISLNLTIVIIAIVYLFQNGQIKRKNYPLYAIFLAIILFALLYLSSRTALISIVLLSFFYFGYFLRKSRKLLFAFSLVFSLFFALFFVIPNRLADSLMTVQNEGVEQLNEPRLEIWKAALEVIEKQPFFGNGTASAREVLLPKFERDNFQHGIIDKLNAHNQYLEYLIEYGWTGLLLFLIALFSIPIVCDKKKRLFYIPFILILTVNLFFETMLNRNSGVTTFAFFLLLLGIKDEYSKSLISEKWKSIYLKISTILSIFLLFFIGYSYYAVKQKDVYFFINYEVKKNGIVLLDKRLESKSWNNNSFFVSPFLYARLTENQRLTINSEVYVSSDFNGNQASIAAENCDIASVFLSEVYYNLNQKGTWQSLELTLENINDEVKVMFYISQYNQTNFDNLQGKVLFRNTTYSIE